MKKKEKEKGRKAKKRKREEKKSKKRKKGEDEPLQENESTTVLDIVDAIAAAQAAAEAAANPQSVEEQARHEQHRQLSRKEKRKLAAAKERELQRQQREEEERRNPYLRRHFDDDPEQGEDADDSALNSGAEEEGEEGAGEDGDEEAGLNPRELKALRRQKKNEELRAQLEAAPHYVAMPPPLPRASAASTVGTTAAATTAAEGSVGGDDDMPPEREWWDESFDGRTDLVHRPVPVPSLKPEIAPVTMKVYLTQKERRKIRKDARREREQERRDLVMVGALPEPEPKFKLGTFMRALGHEAVADPSKVEMRIREQVRKREIRHFMRNQARKLTPAEKREKRWTKRQEDTSIEVHVAIFRVRNLTNRKRFVKVEKTARDFGLTGTITTSKESGISLVVVEGGPRGIRHFCRVMMRRIPWAEPVPADADHLVQHKGKAENGAAEEQTDDEDDVDVDVDDDDNVEPHVQPQKKRRRTESVGDGDGNAEAGEDEDSDDEDGDEEEDGDDEEDAEAGATGDYGLAQHGQMGMSTPGSGADGRENRCDLLWRGSQFTGRSFTGFKLHVGRTDAATRKAMNLLGVPHYWDLAMRADRVLELEAFL